MRKLTKRKFIMNLIILVIFSLSLISAYKNIYFARNRNMGVNNLKSSIVSGKIYINGNLGWAAFRNDGNCTGSGTYSDPYVIEDFVINGSFSDSCIRIGFSDVYFRIENCTLYNSGSVWGNAGILIETAINGQIINNTVYNSFNGIFMSYSNNTKISENKLFNNNDAGIQFWHCSNNIISGNNVSSNSHGIYLADCRHHLISENVINNNGNTGITLTETSTRNKILSNIITNNYVGIILEEGTKCNELSNNYYSGNVEDVQDLQGECPRPENLLPLIIGIISVIISIMIISGLLLTRRRSARRKVVLKEKPVELDILQEEEVISPEEIPIEVGLIKEEIESVPEELPLEKEVVEEPIEEVVLPAEEVVIQEPTEEEILPEKELAEEPIKEVVLPEKVVVVEEPIKEEVLSEEEVVAKLMEVCKFCGANVLAGKTYCSNCGKLLKIPIEEKVLEERELLGEKPIGEEYLPKEEIVVGKPIEEEVLPEEVVVEEPIKEELLPEEEIVKEEPIEEEIIPEEELVVKEPGEEILFSCKFCGIILDKGASFCPQCGTIVKTK